MRLYTLGDRFNLCGERVREARMRMGWSQEELAAKLQWPVFSWDRWP